MSHTPPEPTPRLGLTTRRQVAVAALAGALVCGVILSIFDLAEAYPPVVPWSVPAVLVVMAIGTWIYARGLKRRIAEHEASGIEAVRALVLGKSMVMTGAVLAGGHAVYAGRWLGQLSAPQPAARVLTAAVTMLAGIGVTAAGSFLERACRVPDDDDGEGKARADEAG